MFPQNTEFMKMQNVPEKRKIFSERKSEWICLKETSMNCQWHNGNYIFVRKSLIRDSTKILQLCLSVKNGELTEHTEKLIKPEWKIRLKDEKNGKTLNGRIRISDSEGNFREVNEGDTVQMLPGKSYTLKVCSVEKGYYSGCEQILHVPSEKPEYEIYEIGCRPFFLSLGISDKKTGKTVSVRGSEQTRASMKLPV